MTQDGSSLPPLTAAHVSRMLRHIDPLLISNAADLYRQILLATSSFPGVDSSYLVEIDVHLNTFQQFWLGLEGELRKNEALSLSNSSWQQALQYKTPLIQEMTWASQTTLPPVQSSLPGDTTENPATTAEQSQASSPGYRCILPLYQQKPVFWFLVLQSESRNLFASWDSELLTLIAQQISAGFKTTFAFQNLQDKLSFHHQRLSLMPPSLLYAIQMGQIFVNEANPVISVFQHNLDTLRTYHLKMLEALEYYRDEIRLYAAEDAIQRLSGYEQRNQLADVFADLDPLLQDTFSGIFRLRYFLNFLKGLRPQPSNPEQFQLNAILQPLLSNLFNDKRIQYRFHDHSTIPLYGEPLRIQQVLMELLLAIPPLLDPQASSPHVEVEVYEENNEMVMSIRFSVSSYSALEQATQEEGYLFVKQVIEEHQGSFLVSSEDLQLTWSLHLPIMFEDHAMEVSSDPHTPHSFSVVGPLELPALESTDSLPELPVQTRTRLLFFSSDQLFSRALKRVLSRHIDFLSASTLNEARDLLSAHPDLSLVLCDLEESAEDSFSLLDEIQSYYPGLVPHVCFFVGEAPPPVVADFVRRVSPRCCDRHTSIETIQRFIFRRRRM